MPCILGISGKKQSGKNTTANYIHGKVLKSMGMISNFYVDKAGELAIETTNQVGETGYGVFDVTRKDEEFTSYAERDLWPYIKMYSFADGLKSLCVEFFGLKPEQVYGTDEQKNQIQEHLLWENMPRFVNSNIIKKPPIDSRIGSIQGWEPVKAYWKEGPMTAREFMQYLGTDVMRKMYEPVHVNHALDKILSEQSNLAIVPDVRFPNEVKAIQDAGGKVVRLTRNTRKDNHASECGLDPENFDWDNFDAIIHNDGSLEDTLQKVDEVCSPIIGQ